MAIKNSLTAGDQVTLDNLLQQLKELYKQLKFCEHAPIQNTIIWSLKPKCEQALELLNKASEKSQFIVKKKQVMEIKEKIQQIQAKINKNETKNPQIGNGGRLAKFQVDKSYSHGDLFAEFGEQEVILNNFQPDSTESQKSIKPLAEKQTNNATNYNKFQQSPCRTQSNISRQSLQVLSRIALQQIKSVSLDYTQEQLNEVLKRLQNNQQVVQHTQQMIAKQGNDLQKVEELIQRAYSNINNMNTTELGHAQREQIKSVNKIRDACRKTAMGFWGFFTWPFKKIFKHKSMPVKQQAATPQ